jgi:4'-phosphopantetheinyl transferase EntD
MSLAAELLAASTDHLWHRLVAVQALRDYGVHQSSKRKGPEEGP